MFKIYTYSILIGLSIPFFSNGMEPEEKASMVFSFKAFASKEGGSFQACDPELRKNVDQRLPQLKTAFPIKLPSRTCFKVLKYGGKYFVVQDHDTLKDSLPGK